MLIRSAHIGKPTSRAEFEGLKNLRLDVAHPCAPFHEGIPYGVYMPDLGRPVLWQASAAGFPNVLYTLDGIRSVLKQPGFNGWWVLGNEQDLGFAQIPPASPQEYVQGIVQNMLNIIPIAPAPRRFVLSLGSKIGVDRNWAREVLLEFQRAAPGMLCMFDAFAVNYYSQPLEAKSCLRWLNSVYAMLQSLGVGDRKIWLKELGAGRNQPADDDYVAKFISDFFRIVAKRQARGGLTYLELVGWFSANDLSAYGMPYFTLVKPDGTLTAAGRAWNQLNDNNASA